jgi:hypothetical protein
LFQPPAYVAHRGDPKPLGFSGILRDLETAGSDAERNKIIEELKKEVKFKPVEGDLNKSGQITVVGVAHLLEDLARVRGNLDAALEGKSPEYQDQLRAVHVLVNMMDEVEYQQTKGDAGGTAWYDRDLGEAERGLIHFIRSDPILQEIARPLGAPWEFDPKSDPLNNPRMVLVKAVITPHSYSQQPDKNISTALRQLKVTIERRGGKDPFTKLFPRNPDTQAVLEAEKAGKLQRGEFKKPPKYYGPGGRLLTPKEWIAGTPLYTRTGEPLLQGWTVRADAVEHATLRINALVAEMGEADAARWLLEDHPYEEVRARYPDLEVPDYLKDKPIPGAFIFGPKGGPFFLNLNRRDDHITKDLWFSRTFNRILTSLIADLPKPNRATMDAPFDNLERGWMDRIVEEGARRLGVKPAEFQAALWYFEQTLYRLLGARVDSLSYADGIRKELERAGKDQPSWLTPPSSPDDFRRANAYIRALARRGEKGSAPGNLRSLPELTRYTQRPSGLYVAENVPVAYPAWALKRARRASKMLRLMRRAWLRRFAAMSAYPGSQAVEEPPAPAQEAASTQPSGLLFHTQNVEDLSFDDALQRSRSADAKAWRQLAQQTLEQLGVKKVSTHQAIGDWSDGAEHSALTEIEEPIDSGLLRYAAAWLGLMGNQKAVLLFQHSEKGPDSTYDLKVPLTDLAQVRKALDSAGIAFRTLVAGKNHTRVVIYDEGRQLREKVAKFAEEVRAPVRETQGVGAFIGGSTRSAARRAYREIIRSVESAAPPQ